MSVKQDKRPKPTPIVDSPKLLKWAGIAAALVFVLIGLPYLQSDLWFDECLTLLDYGYAPRLRYVFSTYNVANNHILYSALLWLWLCPLKASNEILLRLPCLVMALLTLYLLYVHGKRLFHHAAAGLFLMLVMAFSPVFLNFFYQMRGYSLSILLATLATAGALYLAIGDLRRGLALYGAGAVLLPMVIPSNLLLNFSLFCFVNVAFRQAGKWKQRRRLLLVLGGLSVVGMLIYVPIFGKLLKVMRTTAGWESGWLASGHWLLAALAHVGVFLLACGILYRNRNLNHNHNPKSKIQNLKSKLPWLALCCAVPMLLALLLRAPFPRALLAYLPPLTFAAMWLYSPGLVKLNKRFYLLILVVLGNLLFWSRLGAFLTQRDLRRGTLRQNLLEQFYSRSRDVSQAARAMSRMEEMTPDTRILVDFHFFLSLRLYWQNLGMDLDQIECLNGEGKKFALQLNPEQYQFLPKLIVAYNAAQAKAAYKRATGTEISLEPLPSPTRLIIFRVVDPTGPEPFPETLPSRK